MITKKSLLKFVSGKGYKGAESATDISAFLDTLNIELQDEDGKAIDVASLFVVEVKKVTIIPDAGEEVVVASPEVEEPMEEESAPKAVETEVAKSTTVVEKEIKTEVKETSKIGKKTMDNFNIGSSSDSVHKIYNSKAQKGLTCYNDASEAEAAGAYFRQAYLGRKDYGQKQSDLDLITKVNLGVVASSPVVPTLVANYIIENLNKYGTCRKVLGSRFVNMSTGLFNLTDMTADAVVAGGAENAAAGDTNSTTPTVVSKALIASKMMGTIQISNELWSDSLVNIGEYVTRSFSRAISRREDVTYFGSTNTATTNCGFYGLTSTAANGGIGTAGTITATGGWSTVTQANVDALKGLISADFDPANYAFTCSQQFFFTKLFPLMKAAALGMSLAEVMYAGKLLNPAADAMLDGFPVFFNAAQASATALGDPCLIFGDFSAFAAGSVNGSLEIATNDSVGFNTDSVYIRAKERFAVKSIRPATDSVIGGLAVLKTSGSVT